MTVTRARVLELARGWLGTPYHHRASIKGAGCDCIGLIRGIWRELYGTEPEGAGAYTGDWAEATGTEALLGAAHRHLAPTTLTAAKPGDVVIFRLRGNVVAKHAAILVGPARMIHAQEGVPVSEVALGPWWRRRIAGVFVLPGVVD
jgi:NlpC/P60 family putative phage cell wall peptidase